MLKTPVVLIIFNRPDFTTRTFEAIAKARPEKLLVIADGPRNETEAEVCERTRSIIRVNWDCELLTNYSDTNLGCRRRVVSGIDWTFGQVEEAIILEDDCIPNPSFFEFCAVMLDQYRLDPRIMMATGSNFLPNGLNIPESYVFSQYFNIWGWATWKRAWKLYDADIRGWPDCRDQEQLEGLIREPRVRDYYARVWNDMPSIDTWDFQWSFSCLFNHGLCVVPRVNLISNVGMFGAHFKGEDHNIDLPTSALDSSTLVHPTLMFPDQRYDRRLFATNELFGREPPPPVPLHLRALRRARCLLGLGRSSS